MSMNLNNSPKFVSMDKKSMISGRKILGTADKARVKPKLDFAFSDEEAPTSRTMPL
jgi:hypothetical protein